MNYKARVLLFTLFTFFLFQSCSTVYYVGETTEPTNIYAAHDYSNVIYVVPIGTKLLIKKKFKDSYYVVYDNYQGYSRNTVLNNFRKFDSKHEGNLYGYSNSKPTTSKSTSTNTGSRASSSSGGAVHVKGYYRKNGTYVKPHTRSSPKRR